MLQRFAFLLVGALLLAPVSAQAATLRLNGRVTSDSAAVSSGMIVLHRASPESAGPIDSLRASANGTFSFRLPSPPDTIEGVVYIASTTHQGIMYFGLPV